MKSSKKSKYMNDPIGHRKSLHGKSFTDCYDKFKKIEHFDLPDICGDIEHTKVYISNIDGNITSKLLDK